MNGYGTPSNLNQSQFATHMPITPPPVADRGAGFALARQQQAPTRVSPFAAANWGASRFTAWNTPAGATYGAATGGSFLNWDAMNRPAPGAVEVQ